MPHETKFWVILPSVRPIDAPKVLKTNYMLDFIAFYLWMTPRILKPIKNKIDDIIGKPFKELG